MPKVIENLQIKILENAKKQMLSKGYHGLNIREIARECGVAIGTIYNYYPSKEMLAAYVMLEDWNLAKNQMKKDQEKAKEMKEVLASIYTELKRFYLKYRSSWRSYTFTRKSTYSYQERHELLRSQLSEIIEVSLVQFTKETNPYMKEFLADILLTTSCRDNVEYEELEEILNRLFLLYQK